MEEGKEGKGGFTKNKEEMNSSVVKYKDPFASKSLSSLKNPWKIATFVLAIIVIILLFIVLKGGITGNVLNVGFVDGALAGQRITDYLNARTNGGVTYLSTVDKGDLYEINVAFEGEEVLVYVTKDGKYFAQGAIPLDQSDVNNINTGIDNRRTISQNIGDLEPFNNVEESLGEEDQS